MNILKKLKLTLLATSVMFFPKAGHTMKPEDELSSAESSRQLRSGGNDSLDLEQLNIAESSSGPLSTTIGALEMERLFGRYFTPSEKTINNLNLLRRTNPSGTQEITNTIREKLLNRFVSPKYKTLEIRIEMKQGGAFSICFDAAEVKPLVDNVTSFALTLSKKAIETRSDQLAKLIIDLAVVEKPLPTDYQAFVIYSPERKLEDEVSINTPFIISLVKDLLKLQPNQVESRAKAIKDNRDFLLPTRELVYPIISSLMKLRTMEIVARANSMKKVIPFINNISDKNQFIMAANKVTNDELELSANNTLSILSSSPKLQYINQLLSLFGVNIERGPSSSSSIGSSVASLSTSHQPSSAHSMFPTASSFEVEPGVKAQQIHPSVTLNPTSFAVVRDDIKGHGLTTPFSFKTTQKGSFEVTGEGILFYQLLPKSIMDTQVGQEFLLEAEIKSETPGGYLQYFNGNERTMSAPYSGGNQWQKLQLEFTVKSGSRYHLVYPLVMPPKTSGSAIPVIEIRNINLTQTQPSGDVGSSNSPSPSSNRDISQRLQYVLSYMETTYKVKKILDLSPIEKERLLQTAKSLVLESGLPLNTAAIKAAYKELYGKDL